MLEKINSLSIQWGQSKSIEKCLIGRITTYLKSPLKGYYALLTPASQDWSFCDRWYTLRTALIVPTETISYICTTGCLECIARRLRKFSELWTWQLVSWKTNHSWVNVYALEFTLQYLQIFSHLFWKTTEKTFNPVQIKESGKAPYNSYKLIFLLPELRNVITFFVGFAILPEEWVR